jgi:hypothetical protein
MKGKNMRNSLDGKPVLLKQNQNKQGELGTAATITLYELMMDLFVEPKRPPVRETRTGHQRKCSRANA